MEKEVRINDTYVSAYKNDQGLAYRMVKHLSKVNSKPLAISGTLFPSRTLMLCDIRKERVGYSFGFIYREDGWDGFFAIKPAGFWWLIWKLFGYVRKRRVILRASIDFNGALNV